MKIHIPKPHHVKLLYNQQWTTSALKHPTLQCSASQTSCFPSPSTHWRGLNQEWVRHWETPTFFGLCASCSCIPLQGWGSTLLLSYSFCALILWFALCFSFLFGNVYNTWCERWTLDGCWFRDWSRRWWPLFWHTRWRWASLLSVEMKNIFQS